MAKTDAEILDGSPIDITFNGKTYTWRPLNRRKQRRVRVDLIKIAGVAVDAQKGSDMVLASAAMEVTAMVQDFCEDYNPEMKSDSDDIDAYIQSNPEVGFGEVMSDIFQPLFDAWVLPWMSTDEPDSKKKTSTKSPRSTKG
jgi:hypothetical protein